MGLGTAIAGLIVSAVGTGASIIEGKKAADAQEEAQEQSGAQQQVDQAEARRRQYRELRQRQASLTQAAQVTGTQGSSGAMGAQGATQTNFLAAQSVQSGQASTQMGIQSQMNKAAGATERAGTYGAVGQIGNSVFSTSMSNTGTRKEFFNLFK